MAYKPMCFKKTVGTAGTAEQLTTANILTPMVIIQAFDDNLTDTTPDGVFVGDNQVDKTLFNGTELNPRESVTFTAVNKGSGVELVDLSNIWIDADVAGDGVAVCYLQEV